MIALLFLFGQELPWQLISLERPVSLRGLAAVDGRRAWVAGSSGTIAFTTTAGRNWEFFDIPDAEQLDFRDLELAGKSLYALAAGPGSASRIYATSDEGERWRQQFTGKDEALFLDALAFWDEHNGVALGDPINGQFQLLATENGGSTWLQRPTASLPAALAGEAAFAASGSCLVAAGSSDLYLVTGGTAARILHSADRGQSWHLLHRLETFAGSPSRGFFSLAIGEGLLLAVGGDYAAPATTGLHASISRDQGANWLALDRPWPYLSSAALYGNPPLIALSGSESSHLSRDGGKTWATHEELGFHTVRFAADGSLWGVGAGGLVARLARQD
jgi:photosystem II stability/assembly factor-like uncharacterized protein